MGSLLVLRAVARHGMIYMSLGEARQQNLCNVAMIDVGVVHVSLVGLECAIDEMEVEGNFYKCWRGV